VFPQFIHAPQLPAIAHPSSSGQHCIWALIETKAILKRVNADELVSQKKDSEEFVLGLKSTRAHGKPGASAR